MNLTLGFIAFFISIVIPGILFRRFFFYGEFSKQFNTKDPVLHSIFFSIIPGIGIQLFSFIIYILWLGFDSSFLDIFIIFRDMTSDGTKGTQEVTKIFINDHIITFFKYSLCVFALSSLLGWISSRFIRYRKWDKKYKLFRFKNQWYYIFSGEVLNMKKFEEAHNVSFKKNKGAIQDTLMTYADVLVSVSEQNDKKELYTGYVVDYDLQSNDITQLDKIYLIDTHRYKKKESDPENNIKAKNIKPTQSRNRLRVPGDIFILNAKNIINLNLTYIPSLEKKIKKEAKKQKKYNVIQFIYVFIILLFVTAHLFYKTLGLDQTFLYNYFTKTGFWGKLVVILFINHFLSFFVPYENDEKQLIYGSFLNIIKNNIIPLILLGGLSFWLAINPLLD